MKSILIHLVQIQNDGGVGNTALDGLVLVFFNGNDDKSYKSIDLDGNSTNSNGYFVVGNSGVNGVGDTAFSTNVLQNGEDAVALYQGNATDFPNGTPVTIINLIDALVYDTGGKEDDVGLLILHNANQPQINENGNGKKDEHSNQRCSNGSGGQRNTSNYLQAIPTPNAANNCTAIVAFSQTAYQINEDGTIVAPQMTLLRSGNTMSASSVQVILNNGSAPAATGGTSAIYPDDFDNTTLTVYFAASETSQTVIVPINDDTEEEDNEKVSLTLANPTNATLGTPTTTTLTINDNDSPSELLINEIDYDQVGSDNAEFIELKNVGSNAIDFSATPYELRLVDANGPTVDKTISLDSGIVNANDYFVICGDVTQVVNCDLDVSPNTGLLENGIEAVALMKSNLIVDVVSYEGDVSGYVETTGTTVKDSNYIALISLSRYPDGVDTNNNSSDFSQRCITPGVANIANSSDCLLPFVQFTQASYVVDENIGNSNVVNLSRSGNNINSLSTEVSISIMDSGTAIAGTDFTDSSFPLSVTFALNETNKTITVPINDDNLEETDETINFSVAATSNAIIGTQGTATLNITDNDVRLNDNAQTPPSSQTPPISRYTLTIEETGNGTVTSNPTGILCGADNDQCRYEFEGGETIKLSATPNVGWALAAWNGDCDDNGYIELLKDATCQPKFALESVTLNDLEVTGVENGLLDFGTLPEGSAPIIKTLTLTNTALVTMDVTGFTLPIGFSLIGDFPENLVPSESVDIQIQWDALTVGHYKDELSFNINGLFVSYTLSGTVIAGEKEAVNEVESVIASEKESSGHA